MKTPKAILKFAMGEALAKVAGVRPSSGAATLSPQKSLEFRALLHGTMSLRPRTGALRRTFAIGSCVALLMAVTTGCESSGGGGGSVSAGMYYGTGFYDPWYYDGYHDGGDIIVVPPPRPEQPIATPLPSPRPAPSIPSGPRPMPRPAMRR